MKTTLDALDAIKARKTSPQTTLIAQLFISLWEWDRRRFAEGGKPLHELTMEEVIAAAEGGELCSRQPRPRRSRLR